MGEQPEALQLDPQHLRERDYEAEQAYTDRCPDLPLFTEDSDKQREARQAAKAAERESLLQGLCFLHHPRRQSCKRGAKRRGFLLRRARSAMCGQPQGERQKTGSLGSPSPDLHSSASSLASGSYIEPDIIDRAP